MAFSAFARQRPNRIRAGFAPGFTLIELMISLLIVTGLLVAVLALFDFSSKLARVHITTAPQGIAAPGTAYRMDELPMPLKPALKSPYPSDEEVVRRINEAIGKKPFWLPDGSQPQMMRTMG